MKDTPSSGGEVNWGGGGGGGVMFWLLPRLLGVSVFKLKRDGSLNVDRLLPTTLIVLLGTLPFVYGVLPVPLVRRYVPGI